MRWGRYTTGKRHRGIVSIHVVSPPWSDQMHSWTNAGLIDALLFLPDGKHRSREWLFPVIE